MPMNRLCRQQMSCLICPSSWHLSSLRGSRLLLRPYLRTNWTSHLNSRASYCESLIVSLYTGLILGRIMEETEKELSGSAEGHDFDDDLPEDDYNLRPEVRGDVAWKALALVTAFIWGSLVTITFLSPAMLKDYMYWLTTGTAILTAVAIILRSRFKPTVEVERIDSEVLKDALLRANQFLNVKGVIDVNALAAVIARTDLVTFAKAALILRRNGLANNYVAQVAENLLSSGGLLVGTQSPDRSLFENAKQQLQDA